MLRSFNKVWPILFLLTVLLIIFNWQSAQTQTSTSVIYSLNLEGSINPITAQYVVQGIEEAENNEAECLILQMDTPGGLDTSMRKMIKKMLNSPIQIIVYISPQAARAASAGAFITLASNLAAMSPGTNIGAASPVTIGGEGQIDEKMKSKVTNDAAAYIKSIASKRNRNEEMAEQFVRESISLTEQEALENNIIEFIADNRDELIFMINGVRVTTNAGTKKLNTTKNKIVEYNMSVKDLFLHNLTNPNIAYILLFLGIYGILGEFSNPGALFPGIFGGICLILAFVAFQTIPINFAGIVLIVVGIVLFIFEIYTPTFGIFSLGGITSLALGSFMLTRSMAPFLQISTGLILTMVLATAAFFLFAITKGIKIQWKKPLTGNETLIGKIGTARTNLNPEGNVFINGEIWQAESQHLQTIKKGQKIKAVSIEGLRLIVQKYDKKEE